MLSELGADPIRGSLSDDAALREGCSGVDAVFHLAGGVRGKGRVTPDVLNRQGTERLLNAGAEDIVFVSSCAVYGDRSNLWVEEDFEASPNTRYGRSKAEAEALVRESGRRHTIVRLAAVYGPGFPFLMEQSIREGKAWLPGEGRNHVPIVHVDDAVSGLLHLAGRGGTWHLAAPEQPTLGEFFSAFHHEVGGRPPRFWSTWLPSYTQSWLARNNERAQSRIGLKPRFTPDSLKLWTASVRLRTDKLAESGFVWRYPEWRVGIHAATNC